MQRITIFHETEYLYNNAVVLGPHRLLVRPRDGHDLRIEASKLAIDPPALVSWHRDELDNSVALATFDQTPTNRLVITSEVTVAHYLSLREEIPISDSARHLPFSYSDAERRALSVYSQSSHTGKKFQQWLASVSGNHTETVAVLKDISSAIYDQCAYEMRDEEGVQTPEETLSKARGSCRDYAWLFVIAARELGMAARFVSGYFHTTGTSLADGSTHAWAEVYLPGSGWTGFDPTSNRMTAENHIPVAAAVMPEDIPPVSGHFTGPANESPRLTVTVHVTPG